MDTLTARRRDTNPAKYRRKDARTRILALVYGVMNHDGTRARLPFTNVAQWEAARDNLYTDLQLAAWPADKVQQIIQDFGNLKSQIREAA